MASVAGVGRLNQRPAQPGIINIPAQSSFISAFEYDPANLTLTTHLKSGAIYQHKFVTPGDFDLLRTSKDHSRFWSTSIRGKKQSVRVKVSKSPNSGIRKGR
jgi:hypothetical protein